jgi:hypothetical protein
MQKQNSILTADRLREILSYDPETGVLTWIAPISSRSKPGEPAGTITPLGYVRIGMFREQHLGHRLAWLHVYGKWPNGDLDHINGVRHDNRLVNLREATRSGNNQNIRAARSDSAHGFLGATWSKAAQKWRASICVNRKQKTLGTFDSAEEAHAAYLKAKAELHPYSTIT